MLSQKKYLYGIDTRHIRENYDGYVQCNFICTKDFEKSYYQTVKNKILENMLKDKYNPMFLYVNDDFHMNIVTYH